MVNFVTVQPRSYMLYYIRTSDWFCYLVSNFVLLLFIWTRAVFGGFLETPYWFDLVSEYILALNLNHHTYVAISYKPLAKYKPLNKLTHN